LSIIHFHRDLKPQQLSTPGLIPPVSTTVLNTGTDDPGFIEYQLFDCFPIRFKPSSDLDGTGSEVSVKELDIAVERFDVKSHDPA